MKLPKLFVYTETRLKNLWYWYIEKPLCELTKSWTWFSPDAWCLLRIVITPFIPYTYLQGYVYLPFILFIVALLSDLIDGPHARSTNQKSDRGAMLDATSDKILTITILLFVGIVKISGLIIYFVLSVELILLLTATILKPWLNQKYNYCLIVGSNIYGKVKMVIQGFAIGFLLLVPMVDFLVGPYSQYFIIICGGLLGVSIILGIASFLKHLDSFNEPLNKDTKKMKIVNVPNLITMFSIVLLVPTGFAIAAKNWWLALPLLALIAISDGIDGWYARRYDQETSFGAVIDPIRDYILRFYLIVWYFIWFDVLAIRVAIVAVILVEVASALINLRTARKCRTVTLVNKWGKYRAVAQYIILLIVFLHKMEIYNLYYLSDYALTTCFFLMLIASLAALISYAEQQAALMLKQRSEKQKTDSP